MMVSTRNSNSEKFECFKRVVRNGVLHQLNFAGEKFETYLTDFFVSL